MTARQWLNAPWGDRAILARRVYSDPAVAGAAFHATNAAYLREIAATDSLAAVLANEPYGPYAYEAVTKAGGCRPWMGFNPQVKRAHFDRWADGTGVEWNDIQAGTIEHLADMGCARVGSLIGPDAVRAAGYAAVQTIKPAGQSIGDLPWGNIALTVGFVAVIGFFIWANEAELKEKRAKHYVAGAWT